MAEMLWFISEEDEVIGAYRDREVAKEEHFLYERR